MKLEKAIETLNYSFIDPWIAPKGDFGDAIKLGIEALKRIQDQRNYRFSNMNRPLPSETEK